MAASDSKYLDFIRTEPSAGRKTPIINVCSKSSGSVLGRIKWYGPWRQFCFYPSRETIFNNGCMADIQSQIDELMAERRK